MFDPDIQYRCTIIRGKAQKDLDDLLPTYANICNDICPLEKSDFKIEFNNKLSQFIYEEDFEHLVDSKKKTINNHRTEIAHKLFGLYYNIGDYVYLSPTSVKLLSDNDQPAFFKNLCLNFQFPNGTQKITTILDRIENKIKFKPFHFIVSLLKYAKDRGTYLTKDELGYYVLNSLQVLQGIISINEVYECIIRHREEGTLRRLEPTSNATQHIREQLNLLSLANLLIIDGDLLILNEKESDVIEIFVSELNTDLKFDIYKYDLNDSREKKIIEEDWSFYFGQIAVSDPLILSTSIEALQRPEVMSDLNQNNLIVNTLSKNNTYTKGINNNILGDEGELFIYNLEKNRVGKKYPRLVNKVIMLGNQRGIGYDIQSVEAEENIDEPEFARYIEVKSTKRITVPDISDSNWIDTINLTRREWIAAKQHRNAYNIYRVYFTPNDTIVRKINDPFGKNSEDILSIIPIMYRMEFDNKSIDKEY